MLNRSISTAALIAASAMFTASSHGQGIQVEAGGTDVQVGGGQGVQVQREGGQRARQGGGRAGGNVQNPQARRGVGNAVIAEWALIDQRNMIELAEYGLQRSKNEAVRQLAQQVLQGHQELATRLEPFAQNPGGQQGAGARADAAEGRAEGRQGARDDRQTRREATREARETSGTADADTGGLAGGIERLGDRLESGAERLAEETVDAAEATREGIDRVIDGDDDRPAGGRMTGVNSPLLDIHREIATAAASQARTQLEQYQGVEFDEAFVGLLGSSHLAEQATLTVLSDRARGELAPVLKDGLSSVREHLAQAKRTMEQLEPKADR